MFNYINLLKHIKASEIFKLKQNHLNYTSR